MMKWLMRVTETWAAMDEMGLGLDVIFGIKYCLHI
jgi:hypothetical protein